MQCRYAKLLCQPKAWTITARSFNGNKHSEIFKRISKLDQNHHVYAEYVWIDGSGERMRSKTRTLDYVPKSIGDVPKWGFDGSSTGQAEGSNSDVFLNPCAMYSDPIRLGNNKLILCDTYLKSGKPTKSNKRNSCAEAFEQITHLEPNFGLEQEYTLLDTDFQPLGWPKGGFPASQGKYYCGVGSDAVYGRTLVEAHFKACSYANVNIGGINAEVMPSQWEFQVGPNEGISICDDLWMARFLLYRLAEELDIIVTLDPKPVEGDWNGAGCHANFSTKQMMQEGGLKEIFKAIRKLEPAHMKHIGAYDPKGGIDNSRRLTGRHETSSIEQFSFGVADRGASIRIPRHVEQAGKGYLEDRRPSSNCDPYSVCDALIITICM